jgi:hypothetical protein
MKTRSHRLYSQDLTVVQDHDEFIGQEEDVRIQEDDEEEDVIIQEEDEKNVRIQRRMMII